MKIGTGISCVVALLATAGQCLKLNPAWGIGHYGGVIGVWYPYSTTTSSSAIPSTTSSAAPSATSLFSSASETMGMMGLANAEITSSESEPEFTATVTSTTTSYTTVIVTRARPT